MLTFVVSRSTVVEVKRGVLLWDVNGSVAGSRETGLRQAYDINAVRETDAHCDCLCSFVAKSADVPARYVGALLASEDWGWD